MLQLIGYDLKEPRHYRALKKAIAAAGGGINIMNGPWLTGEDKTPQWILTKVRKGLKKKDKALVVLLGMGEIGTGRKDALFGAPKKAKKGATGSKKAEAQHIVAIAYTLRNRKGRFKISQKEQDRHKQAVKSLVKSFEETCHPVDALWFVRSEQPAHRVRLALENRAPFTTKDELMVVDVLRTKEGVSYNLDEEHVKWLRKYDVLAA